MARSKLNFKKIAMDTLALSGGAATSGILDSMLLNKISGGALDPKIKALIKIGIGAVVPALLEKGKEGFITSFGDGIVAVGGYELLHAVMPGQIPAIQGIGNSQYIYNRQIPAAQMNGVGSLSTINGDLSTINGIGDAQAAADSFLE